MTNPLYLAMTMEEISTAAALPTHMGWMACHFSPEGNGLTDLPPTPFPGSILIVNDRFPVEKHAQEPVFDALAEYLLAVPCRGVLLDFQRPENAATAAIVRALQSLPCPVCVTEAYAKLTHGPVFLSAPAPHQRPDEYLAPWAEREIWLEISAEAEKCVLTEEGCEIVPAAAEGRDAPVHANPTLCCHYSISTYPGRAEFYLYRTKEDIHALVEACSSNGAALSIGLWQELHGMMG